MERCAGCSKPGEPVCGDCRELVARGVEVRAVRSLLWLAAALTVISAAGTAWGVQMTLDGWFGAGRVVMVFGVALAVCGAWWWRELRRIRLARWERGELLLADGLGRRRRVPIDDLEVADGRIRQRSRGETWLIGEVRFPGAAELHRALRAALDLDRRRSRSPPIC